MKKINLCVLGIIVAQIVCAALEEKLCISGVYPNLHTFNNEGECGTGAVVPWAGSLWCVSYAPHAPEGSTDRLYEIRPDKTRIVRAESIGGTPANRMIHRESNQLFIGPYVIDAAGHVRVIPPRQADGTPHLYGRLTANMRHLTDPANKIYYATMEEGFYEVDVHSLAVTELFKDGNLQEGDLGGSLLPGYHGKGAYTAQGRVVYANNGERGLAALRDPTTEAGVLAQWNGKDWEVVLRNQFTEVTGPGGITGADDPARDPLWSVGWDHRSVILMVLDGGVWHRYRLPKGSHSYDGAHGWNTEWPRIREIGTGNDYLMTMHGTFFKFPATFSATNSAGIMARSNYLKVVGDFCRWGDKVVLGCDDTAANEFLNKRRAKGGIGGPLQSNSSLWFVAPEELDTFGPVIGRGAVWQEEDVAAGTVSDPYLYDGYESRHLVLTAANSGLVEFAVDRKGDGQWETIRSLPVHKDAVVVYELLMDKPTAWIRLTAKSDLKKMTAFFNYANSDRRPVGAARATATKGLLRSGKGDADLPLEFAQGDTYYEMRPDAAGRLRLAVVTNEQKLKDLQTQMAIKSGAALGDSYDAASAVITDDDGRRWRFPYANEAMRAAYTREGRLCRECCTERDLLNLAGLLYELPAENAGGFAKVRAVSAPGVAAYDYCSWRGLFVIAGLDPQIDAGTVVTSDDGKASLWVGVADDLWKFGKPVGVGGPWKDTAVKAGVPSDPYLMTGFDRKKVTLSADRDVDITLEIDITGTGVWATLPKIKALKSSLVWPVRGGATQTYELRLETTALRAYWIRATANRDCTATVQLVYE